jgi:uncharacterized RDD family membrane protein YckC
MTCGRCGTAIPESAAFCPGCGAPAGMAVATPAEPRGPFTPSSEFGERSLEPGPRPEAPSAPAWSPPPPVEPAPPAWTPPAAPTWTPPAPPAPPAPQWGGVAATRVAYAGFWRRFGAWILDAILLNLVGTLISFSMGVNPWSADVDFGPAYFGSLAANIFVTWLYSAFMESSALQATIGQLATSIRVTDLAGRRIGFGRATARHFAQILSVLTLCVGYLMIAFTEKKQALHDMVAGCVLVKRTT